MRSKWFCRLEVLLVLFFVSALVVFSKASTLSVPECLKWSFCANPKNNICHSISPPPNWREFNLLTLCIWFQHVDEENSYLCGYLRINGLTDEYPTLTTFFDGEIISSKYPFLTRKWDADEDVDKKHWVCFIN